MRRRFIRPPLYPPIGRQLPTRPVHPLLIKANQLMQEGNYVEAAELFEQLAHGAQARGFPRAPQLFLQAAKARLAAGQVQPAMGLTRQGLGLLAQAYRWSELSSAGSRVVAALNSQGHTTEGEEIAKWLEQILQSHGGLQQISPTELTKKPHLPVSCPHCGGAIRPGEVNWVDDITAECEFCGNMVRAE